MRSVQNQTFKPVALPEQSLLSYAHATPPLGEGQGAQCAVGPSLYTWTRVRSSGRARTRETTIPGAETGTETEPWTSSRRAPSAGNNVAKAIGFLPEERGQSAPRSRMTRMPRMARQSRLPRIFRLPGLDSRTITALPARERGKERTAAASGRICSLFFKDLFKDDLRGSLLGDFRISPVCSRDVPVAFP